MFWHDRYEANYRNSTRTQEKHTNNKQQKKTRWESEDKKKITPQNNGMHNFIIVKEKFVKWVFS